MPKEYQLQVSPEIAANESLLNAHVAQIVRVSTKLVHKVVVLKRSIDARQKAIKVNLKVSVYLIDEKYTEPKFELPTYQNVANKQEVIIVGAGPAGLFAALQLIELGLKPIARLVSSAVAGVHPRIMGIGPVAAIPKALKQESRMSIDEVQIPLESPCQQCEVVAE